MLHNVLTAIKHRWIATQVFVHPIGGPVQSRWDGTRKVAWRGGGAAPIVATLDPTKLNWHGQRFDTSFFSDNLWKLLEAKLNNEMCLDVVRPKTWAVPKTLEKKMTTSDDFGFIGRYVHSTR